MKSKLIIDNDKFSTFLELNKIGGREFELRFQNINIAQFELIKSNLPPPQKKVVSKSYILENNIRVEVFGKKTEFIRKREISSRKTMISGIPIKLSCSSEEKIPPIKYQTPIQTRTKYRSVYQFDNYHIDLTFVKTAVKNIISESFEVEIEYNQNSTISTVRSSIEKILEILYPDRFSYIENDIGRNIRTKYKSLFPDVKSKANNYIYETKARNFKKTDMKNFKHSITNKLNGVNFFLFCCDNKAYFLNHAIEDYIGNIQNLNDTLIQGELYQGTYYIFDVLFVRSEDVRLFNHEQRLNKLSKLLPLLNENLNLKVEYKVFYRTGDNYKNLMHCMNSLSRDKSGNIDMEVNDGFIFTPMDEGYANLNTWKYKFQETMTNDFSVKRDNGNVYSIFVYNEDKQLTPFKYGDKYYKMIYSGKDIFDNMIVECHFDKDSGFFVPYRIRYDKVLPNFYKVAIDNFDDIMFPITISDLQNIFQLANLEKLKKLDLISIVINLFPSKIREIKKMRKNLIIELIREYYK